MRLFLLYMAFAAAGCAQSWLQWGMNARHSGHSPLLGQRPARVIAEKQYDPFAKQAQAEGRGDLFVHYQAPLTDGPDVFMAFKSGQYVSCFPPGSGVPAPCGPSAWNRQQWNQKRLQWQDERLEEVWTFESDWKPVPNADNALLGWEPVFHSALTPTDLWVPAAGGDVFQVNREDGTLRRRHRPFGEETSADKFVTSPLTIDDQGNVIYNVLELDPQDPWGLRGQDIPGAWVVKIAPDGTIAKVSYKDLIPDAPALCRGTFAGQPFPWPPAPGAVPPSVPCLSQRPGVNIAPAVAADGTIYTVSRAHRSPRYSYLIALEPDLKLKWAASLRDRIHDGCGGILPIGGPNGCRQGTPANGVDPETNEAPAGQVLDLSTASPVVAPDGSILFGAWARYNYSRGQLFHFSSGGEFLHSFNFGWDTTPAIWEHDGTYSVIIKENNYDVPSYCFDPSLCPSRESGPYYITQLDSNLRVEWRFQNTNTEECSRQEDGSMRCAPALAGGFEWCINGPAVDAAGNVYANAEDGRLYVIGQGGQLVSSIFLNLALGAAYTPLSIGHDGRIYTENDGTLFVVGE